MITQLYFVALALAGLMALSQWQKAIYAAIMLDFARDPVRKLDPGESVIITVSVLLLWGVITVAAFQQNRHRLASIYAAHPLVLRAIRLMAFALIPGSAISLLFYSEGYKMVALGVVSYLAPFAGILLGYLLVQYPQQFLRYLKFYCFVNGIALISVLAEYSHWGWPCLGGLRGMHWIRYSGSDIVNLIGGWYRSPDIMGLHAAQVVMFSATLGFQSRNGRLPWIVLAVFSCICLLLGGRRKMLGMPFIFAAVLIFACYRFGLRSFAAKFMPVIGIVAAVAATYLMLSDSGDGYVSREYVDYASTLFTDGAARYQQIVGGSVRSSLQQGGILGRGIGSSTQGAHHVVSQKGGWQEDGVSRVVNELGIPGAMLVVLAVLTMLKAIVKSLSSYQPSSNVRLLQICLLAIFVANLASFTASHQQLSGDPSSAILVLIMLGGVFGLADFRHPAPPIKLPLRKPRQVPSGSSLPSSTST